MRSFLFFLAFVGVIVGTIGWILGGSRQIGRLSLPESYDDEGL
jgi:hypothetical protein